MPGGLRSAYTSQYSKPHLLHTRCARRVWLLAQRSPFWRGHNTMTVQTPDYTALMMPGGLRSSYTSQYSKPHLLHTRCEGCGFWHSEAHSGAAICPHWVTPRLSAPIEWLPIEWPPVKWSPIEWALQLSGPPLSDPYWVPPIEWALQLSEPLLSDPYRVTPLLSDCPLSDSLNESPPIEWSPICSVLDPCILEITDSGSKGPRIQRLPPGQGDLEWLPSKDEYSIMLYALQKHWLANNNLPRQF